MVRTFMLKVHFEEGHYWAEVDELPGCFASGRDMDELKDALGEAIGMYLDKQQVSMVEIQPSSPPPVQKARATAELIPA